MEHSIEYIIQILSQFKCEYKLNSIFFIIIQSKHFYIIYLFNYEINGKLWDKLLRDVKCELSVKSWD